MGSGNPEKEPAESGAAAAEVLAEGPIERLKEMGRILGSDVPRKIIELYLADAPARLREIARTATTGDAQALEGAAHSLKGSSANLGAASFAKLCHEFERSSASMPRAETEARLETLQAEYARVEQAMRRLLAELG